MAGPDAGLLVDIAAFGRLPSPAELPRLRAALDRLAADACRAAYSA